MSKHLRPSDQIADFRVHLLGGFSVAVGPRLIPDEAWRLRKATLLVKLLALAPQHRLHREEVLDRLWPEFDARAANNNLHQTLHELRRVIASHGGDGNGFVQLRADTLGLCAAPLWIDMEEFERAAALAQRGSDPRAYETAIDLYRGELLPEDRYEDWIGPRRDAIRAACIDLLVELAHLLESRHAWPEAIHALDRALALDEGHEEAHTRLMHLYALTGQRQRALRQYRLLTATLMRELDAEPSRTSRELYLAILDGRFPSSSEPPVDTRRAPATYSRAILSALGSPRQPKSPPNNLPAQLTTFVGRERQLAQIKELLRSTRLLTLTGTGGVGKTRLALQAVGSMLEDVPDGVWLVELASVTRSDLVSPTVAMVLGVREQPGRDIAETLAEALRGTSCLLVLDNCEHLLDGCAQLTDHLLRACPGLRVVATSRQGLRTAGEVTFTVPPLSVPDMQVTSLDAFLQSEAARLFEERACAAIPKFAMTPDQAPAVAQICASLDGIPLAIELAAALVRALSVSTIARRLDDSVHFLTGGSRVVMARQQTLSATLAWSHDLLTTPEAVLFRRLTVFRGGFSLEAAEVVCAGDGLEPAEVVELLAQLVDKSLVTVEEGGTELRYRLLEPVRQYGAVRLQAASEAKSVQERHRDWCLELAERAAPEIWRADQGWWLDRLTAEHDNIRSALDWSAHRGGDTTLGLRLASVVWPFWLIRGHLAEGRGWLEETLRQALTRAPARAQALLGVFALAIRQGDADGARSAAMARVDASQRHGDSAGAGRALHDLAVVHWLQGDYDSAGRHLDTGLRLLREATDPVGQAHTTQSRGVLAWCAGDHGQAEGLLRESLALAQNRSGARNLAPLLNQGWSERRGADGQERVCIEETLVLFRAVGTAELAGHGLMNLGNLARARGDMASARSLLEEGLERFRSANDRTGIGFALSNLGNLAAWEGDHDRAHTLLEQSLALRQAVGDRRGVGMTLANLGRLAGERNDAQAETHFAESLALFREAGDRPGIAIVTGELGVLASAAGNWTTAQGLLEESLSVFADLGVQLGMALCHRDLGMLAGSRGDHLMARRHMHISLALLQRLGNQRHVALVQHELDR